MSSTTQLPDTTQLPGTLREGAPRPAQPQQGDEAHKPARQQQGDAAHKPAQQQGDATRFTDWAAI